jgi:hypothetical protein
MIAAFTSPELVFREKGGDLIIFQSGKASPQSKARSARTQLKKWKPIIGG